MKTLGYISLALIGFFVLTICTIAMRGCGAVVGTANKAIDEVADQVDPHKLMQRYLWFKDAAASLDAKKATIANYDARLASMFITKDPRRYEVEQANLWQTERLGVVASYNQLASEYNANMAKINWQFCNVGKQPDGSTEPLPREFKPYMTK